MSGSLCILKYSEYKQSQNHRELTEIIGPFPTQAAAVDCLKGRKAIQISIDPLTWFVDDPNSDTRYRYEISPMTAGLVNWIKHANPILDDLWVAMSKLYDARYRVSGEADKPGGVFDHDTFSAIAGLQTNLQTLITKLEDKVKAEKARVK